VICCIACADPVIPWTDTLELMYRRGRHGGFDMAVWQSSAGRGVLALAALLLVQSAHGQAMQQETKSALSITREDYRGWPDTYRLANGQIEVAVVTAVGPRIIELKRTGGPNLFHVRAAEAGGHGEPDWVFRGGWRLWIAPERRATTYVPDNTRCAAEVLGGTTLRITGPPQPAAGIQKVVDVSLAERDPRVRVVSHIRNVSDGPLTYAAWSLAVMRPGGRAFAPLDVGPLDAFDATRKLLLWSYAEMSDPRYRFGDRLVQIDQSAVRPAPAGQSGRRDDESKIGVDSSQGWAAYLVDGTLYLKRFPHDPTGRYPDGGATVEIYSSAEFLEVEQLSPLTTIAPGEEIVFPEEWWVFGDVAVPPNEPAALQTLQPLVDRTATTWGKD